MPVLGWLTRRFGALPMPDLGRYGAAGRQEVERAIQDCADLLAGGGNLVLYPGGHLASSRLEELGGNSAVETILRLAPGTRVVLVRTRGLWGSRFSRVLGPPDFLRALVRSGWDLLASFIFFAPRREVTVELAEPADLPVRSGREALNRRLEAFYNDGARPALHVPHTLWEAGGRRTLPDPPQVRLAGDLAEVPRATREQVLAQLERMTGRGGLGDDAELARDLGMDSLMRLELQFWIEQEFAHPVSDPESLRTVGDVLLAACGKSVDPGGAPLKPVPSDWFGADRPAVLVPEGRDPDRGVPGPGRARPRPGRPGRPDGRLQDLPRHHHLRPGPEAGDPGHRRPLCGHHAAGIKRGRGALPGRGLRRQDPGHGELEHRHEEHGPRPGPAGGEAGAHLGEGGGPDPVPGHGPGAAGGPPAAAGAGRARAFRGGQAQGPAQGLDVLARAAPAGRRDRRGAVHQRQREPAQGGAAHPRQHPRQHPRPGGGIRASCRRTGSSGMLPPFHSFGLTCTMLLPLCSGMQRGLLTPCPPTAGSWPGTSRATARPSWWAPPPSWPASSGPPGTRS